MRRRARPPSRPESPRPHRQLAAQAHASTPQACAGAQSVAVGGRYTSTQLASVFGLDQLFAQGRTGIGQSIAIVEFEQYAASDVAAFQGCYGLSNPIRNVPVDGGAGGPRLGRGRGRTRYGTRRLQRPFRLPGRLRGAQRQRRAGVRPLQPHRQRRHRPGRHDELGRLRGEHVPRRSGDRERHLPAHGPAGADGDRRLGRRRLRGLPSDERFGPARRRRSQLATRRRQRGRHGPAQRIGLLAIGLERLRGLDDGSARTTRPSAATGGGYSVEWPANPGQPAATGPDTTPCGLSTCRAVPDFSYPSDPSAGGVAAYWSGHWTDFGGTSVAAPANAGLFADTNQGCFRALGRVGPALYVGATGQQRHLHRHHPGQQRLHRHQRRALRRRHRLRPGQRARHACRPEPGHSAARRRRLPVGRRREPQHGAGQRRGRHHDLRGRVRQRHLGDVRVGGRRAHRVADGHFHHRRPARRARPRSAWT